MIRSQLQDYRGDDPTWGFVAQLGAEQFTGEVQLGSTTRVRLFVDEGAIYFAERDGDAPVQSRLVVRGALSPAQLARGGIFVDGTVSLARLFARDSSIDRHEVETALERLTQEVLDEAGPQPVGHVQLTPLRHHDTGIHEWARRIQPPVIRSAPIAAPAPVRPAPSVAPLTIAAPPAAPTPLAPPTAAPVESPFSAPPAPATAAPMPAPLPAPALLPPVVEAPAPVVAEEAAPAPTGDRYTPADFTGIELPKLSTKVVSVAELSAAHSSGHGTAEAGDRFTPTDFSGMELPKLATKVMSVSELTAKLAEPEIEIEIEPEPEPEVVTELEAEVDTATTTMFDSGPIPAIHAAPMPGLPALHMGPSGAPVASSEDHHAEPDTDHDTLTDHDTRLDHDTQLDHDTGDDASVGREPESIAAWATPAQNLAAVEIWDMVDTLLAEEHDDSELVSAGGPTDHKGGRWRRGRKG